MSVTTYGVGGSVSEQWDDVARVYTDFRPTPATMRAFTAAENTAADARSAAETTSANAASLRTKAAQAVAVNDAFLALVTPSNAQVVTHVQRLTRENTALIRLVIGQLDTTSGT